MYGAANIKLVDFVGIILLKEGKMVLLLACMLVCIMRCRYARTQKLLGLHKKS